LIVLGVYTPQIDQTGRSARGGRHPSLPTQPQFAEPAHRT
jgi:hypothetical protein